MMKRHITRYLYIHLKHASCDESGVAMVMTMALMLFMVVIASAGFATGNMVTKRVELQNAADAAAYSAAVVQADTLSRIAVINRAMSWTYVMMCRRQMDYACDVWLNKTCTMFKKDLEKVKNFNRPSCHPKFPYVGYFCGTNMLHRFITLNGTNVDLARDIRDSLDIDGEMQNDTMIPNDDDKEAEEGDASADTGKTITILDEDGTEVEIPENDDVKNLLVYSGGRAGSKDVLYDVIKTSTLGAKAAGKASALLQIQIRTDGNAIRSMNQAEKSLLVRLPNRIKSTVETILQANLTGGHIGTSKLIYRLEQSQSPESAYTEIMSNTAANEKRFLVFGGFAEDVRSISTRGMDVWFRRDSGVSKGFRRVYHQTTGSLISKWNGYAILWEHIKVCVPVTFVTLQEIGGTCEVKGTDCGLIESAPIVSDATVQPRILKSDFFGKAGSIVVAVARQAENPFAYQGDEHERGPFAVFNPGTSHLWAVSAARAAHGMPNEKTRNFRLGWDSAVKEQKKWNLYADDWDAVFLPVADAWNMCQGKAFKDEGKNALTGIMQEGSWKTLTGGSAHARFSSYSWNDLSKKLRH